MDGTPFTAQILLFVTATNLQKTLAFSNRNIKILNSYAKHVCNFF